MLFVAVLKGRGKPSHETIARRMKWSYPEGVKVIGEYWPQNGEMSVVSILEAERVEQIMAITSAWSDAFAITVSPAVTAEDGMAVAQQMFG